MLALFTALAMSFLLFAPGHARAQTTTTTASSTTTSTTSGSTTTTTTNSSSTTSTTGNSSSTSTTANSSTTTTTAPKCDNDYSAGKVSPGQTVLGTLNLSNGCKFTATGKQPISVTLNGTTITKDPDANGGVSVTVQINSLNNGFLGDPQPVTLHQGVNTVVVTGPAQTSSGTSAGSSTITASFDLEPATTATTSAVVTPVQTTTSSGSGSSGLALTGANLLALVAFALVTIALGTHAMAARWRVAGATAMPLRFGGQNKWTTESVMLTAAWYIFGPPPGRHAKTTAGPRGLVPIVRGWISRDG